MAAQRFFAGLLVVSVALAAALPTLSEPAFLRTTAALDEPRGYCIDIRGQGAGLRLDAPLQGHTCKLRNWVDMLIDDGLGVAAGRLYMPEYDQCIAATGAEPGADLILTGCTGGPLQLWVHSPGGRIVLSQAAQLCITLAPGAGLNAGGVQYLRRDLALALCDPAADERQIWAFQAPD